MFGYSACFHTGGSGAPEAACLNGRADELKRKCIFRSDVGPARVYDRSSDRVKYFEPRSTRAFLRRNWSGQN